MSDHICNYEDRWLQTSKDLSELTTTLKHISERICQHIDEGERQGGFRDRLLIAERQISEQKEQISIIKRGYWKVALVSGFIGGLLGKITPDLFNLLIKAVFANG